MRFDNAILMRILIPLLAILVIYHFFQWVIWFFSKKSCCDAVVLGQENGKWNRSLVKYQYQTESGTNYTGKTAAEDSQTTGASQKKFPVYYSTVHPEKSIPVAKYRQHFRDFLVFLITWIILAFVFFVFSPPA